MAAFSPTKHWFCMYLCQPVDWMRWPVCVVYTYIVALGVAGDQPDDVSFVVNTWLNALVNRHAVR